GLVDGVRCPTRSTSAAPSVGVTWATTQGACAAARGRQAPVRSPARRSHGQTCRATLLVPIQTPRDPYWSHRTGIRRCTPQDTMVPLPVDLDRRAIQVEAGQGVAQRCALGGATELRQR